MDNLSPDEDRQPLVIKRTGEGKNYLVLRVEGDLDLTTVAPFRKQIESEVMQPDDQRALILDLSLLNFADSSALNAFFQLRRRLREKQRDLLMAAPTTTVLRLLRLLHLDSYIATYPGVEDAVQSLS